VRLIGLLCFLTAPFVALFCACAVFYKTCAIGFELAIITMRTGK
jgi:hypothetical protein